MIGCMLYLIAYQIRERRYTKVKRNIKVQKFPICIQTEYFLHMIFMRKYILEGPHLPACMCYISVYKGGLSNCCHMALNIVYVIYMGLEETFEGDFAEMCTE
jgi:predicted nucleic acid-binding Zn finger protein